MCVVFQKPEKAAQWCIHMQQALLKVDWPLELLTHPAAAEDWGDVDDAVIFRVRGNQLHTTPSFLSPPPPPPPPTTTKQGPRVRMGLHVGQPRRVVDPTTRRSEYMGQPVNVAGHITTLAQAGQVIMTQSFLERIKNSDLAKETNRCIYIGKNRSTEGE